MALMELSSQRQLKSIKFVDTDDLQKMRLVSSIAPLNYHDGNTYQHIDVTPIRVNNAQFDGWQIVNNGWHFAIGKPQNNSDGWVGFGGKRGQHWFRFRLVRLGYFDNPVQNPNLANNFFDIGGNPNYTRQGNLSQSVNINNIENLEIKNKSFVEWRNIWNTPQSGELFLRWVVTGDRLKEEVVINQAARNWIANNRPPSFFGLNASTTYFGFVFELDWSDIPKRIVNGVEKNINSDFNDDNGNIKLHNSLDELLAFMPLDKAYVNEQIDTGLFDTQNNPIIETKRTNINLRKRFWKNSDGKHYLVIGTLVNNLALLPSGDIVFDPTFNSSVAASSDDVDLNDVGYDDTKTDMVVGGVGPSPSTNYGQGWRFDNITLSSSDTVNSAYITLVKSGSQWQQFNNRWTVIDEDDTATFSSGSPPGSRAIVSVTPITDDSNVNHVDATAYSFPPSGSRATFGSMFQEVIDRGGWASGNAIAVVNNSAQDTGASQSFSRKNFASYDHATLAAPSLTIDYTAGSGGQNVSLNSASSAAVGNSLNRSVGSINRTVNNSSASSSGLALNNILTQIINNAISSAIGNELNRSTGNINRTINKSDAPALGYNVSNTLLQIIDLANASAIGINTDRQTGNVNKELNFAQANAIGNVIITGLLGLPDSAGANAQGYNTNRNTGGISVSVDKSDGTALGHDTNTVSGTVINVDFSNANALGNALNFVAGSVSKSLNVANASAIGHSPQTNYFNSINLADAIAQGYNTAYQFSGQTKTVNQALASGIGYNVNRSVSAIAVLVNPSGALAIGYSVNPGTFILVTHPENTFSLKAENRMFEITEETRIYILHNENRTLGVIN